MTGRGKILVVDDDRKMVKTLCDILQVKGYEALPAYTGEEAVAYVQSGGWDCVLMDLKMSGIDGVSALKRIRNLNAELPVVLMSAYATDDQIAEAKTRGAYTVLSKPLDIEAVLSFLALLRKEQSILVVDDDPLFCRTLRDILQVRGVAVETETDPDQVLGHLERSYRLMVLLDLQLGRMSGLEVLKKIRARYPTKPIVLVTGYGREKAGSLMKGRQIGAYGSLYKPFEAEALIGTIKEINKKKLLSVLGEPFEDEPSAT